MMRLKGTVLFFFFCCSVSHAEYFSAPLLKADWKIHRGLSSCQLTQHIPLYGPVVFKHQSGGLLQFSISEERFKPEIVKASLTTDTSSWGKKSMFRKDYFVTLDYDINNQHYPRLSVYGEAAESMLDALSNGLNPTFSYVRASLDGFSDETMVAVSSINFTKKYKKFIACRKDFLPIGFKQRLEKSLFFKPGSKVLSPQVVTQLKDTVRYAKDVHGTRVVIVSDTAIAGSRDKRWFLNRAKKIADKLKKLGFSKNKVTVKSGFYTEVADTKIIQLKIFGPDALKAIYYRKGNTKLTQNEQHRLDVFIRYAEEFLPDSRLVIRSYTDSKGKQANNLKISQQRGDEIKRYLIRKGIDENKVQVKAYGETKPVKSNRFPTGRAQNRRAVIDFVG